MAGGSSRSFPVTFEDELGRGVADLESLSCSIDGHVFQHHKVNKFLSFLSKARATLGEIKEWFFFSSLALLYYSSSSLPI